MSDIKTEVLVLGSGPGGYSAAFRAADLGKKVTIVEKYNNIGGVCLHVGCIPSKALLHVVKMMSQTKRLQQEGLVTFNNFIYRKSKILNYKNKIIRELTIGLTGLAKYRKIKVIQGVGQFSSSDRIEVTSKVGTQNIEFEKAIISVGSRAIELDFMPRDPRIINSTEALLLKEIPNKMLIIGGGIIGIEMAQIYNELGSKVTIIECTGQLIGNADEDIVKQYEKMYSRIYDIRLNTKVTSVSSQKNGLYVSMKRSKLTLQSERFDCILVAVGRAPNGKLIRTEAAGIKVNEKGFIIVDNQLKTSAKNIFAIGDVIGQPMLAHKAVSQGRLVAEMIAGYKQHYCEPKCIPSVVYTDPEVAWIGVTEKEALNKGIRYGRGIFPWSANGRALSIGRSEGLTKLLYDKNNTIIGAGIIGPNAGELISEASLAIEMGCNAKDIALTMHPHPTLSESLRVASEAYEGTATDIYCR